jgi:hypothetical protein
MLRAERITPVPAPRAPAGAEEIPLSHHEIMALVGPFARSGRAVDLAASDRLARRLDFKPQDRLEPGVREQLRLEGIGREGFSLRRTLTRPGCTPATLECEGQDTATLLRWIDGVPGDVHWRSGPDWTLVLHHRLAAPPRGAPEGTPPRLILTRAEATLAAVPGLRLQATVSRVKNVPVALELRDEGERPPKLPEDLLSVLGLDWSRLARYGSLWRATVRVKGDGQERSAHAERQLLQGVEHLARTLAEAPGRFHERFAAARWRVTLRRGFPLLVCLGLIGSAAAVPWMGITRESIYQMLVFNAPPILMVWLFSMRELPRIEIPPLPRRPADTDWGFNPGG